MVEQRSWANWVGGLGLSGSGLAVCGFRFFWIWGRVGSFSWRGGIFLQKSTLSRCGRNMGQGSRLEAPAPHTPMLQGRPWSFAPTSRTGGSSGL